MKYINITVIIVIAGIIGTYWFWPRNKFADFECAGQITWCETTSFGKVPICKEDNLMNIPSAFYGESVSLGKIGGYFWNGRTPEDDKKDISNNLKDYFQAEAEANEKMFKEMAECLKLN